LNLPSFIPNENRDATNVVGGFLYQIQLTVLRWLDLTDGTVLICECGEDIDHVRTSSDEPFQVSRVLEQVKRTSQNITFKHANAISALAHFLDAIYKNPDQNLRYQFSTTSSIGREQNSNFPDGQSGIDTWNKISDGRLTDEEKEAAVNEIVRVIVESSQPSSLQVDLFNQLKNYLESTDQNTLVENLIHKFEWITDLPGSSQLSDQIQNRLIEKLKSHMQTAHFRFYVSMRPGCTGLASAVCTASTKHPIDLT